MQSQTHRNTLFIGHATPEDNEFAIWLASRLQLLGYEVWLDKKSLLGGEKFWQEIDQVIRYRAAKYLLVYSMNICIGGKAGNLKSGIAKEYELAESIASSEGITDFIMLLKTDASPFNLFIGANRYNHVLFDQNWATGLEALHTKLTKDTVPRTEPHSLKEFTEWYETSYSSQSKIFERKEFYYSSYLPILSYPQKAFTINLNPDASAEEARNLFPNQVIGIIGTQITGFIDKHNSIESIRIEDISDRTNSSSLKSIDCFDDSGNFASRNKTHQNLLIHLFKESFHSLMLEKGLHFTLNAHNERIYYYPLKHPKAKGATVIYQHRRDPSKKASPSRKYLVGNYLDMGNWHFGVSARVVYSPFFSYTLQTHIIFTHDGEKIWTDAQKMHSHRRKKGKRFFNKEWRDLLLAMIQSWQDEKGEIRIKVTSATEVILKSDPFGIWANFGFRDPRGPDRQDLLAIQEFEDDDAADE